MKLKTTVLLLLIGTACFAQEGYEIKVTLKPFRNQYIYLGHYYGKQLPIIDSVKLNDKSEGTFKGKKKLGGGIYLVGYPDRMHNFEMLVDKNQKFSVVADTSKMGAISFINSPENTSFKAYQQFMTTNGRSLDSIFRLRAAAPGSDSVRLTKLAESYNQKIRKYRSDLITKQPNSLLSTLLKAMKEPEVPPQPAGNKDSLYAYHYYKNHYWDDVNFYDDRLARTPFFESRIDKYMEQLVYPSADSVIKELDYMLGYASINEEMQKFLLLKFVNRYLNQKYMWEDAVFVHLFEKYFSQKSYSWLNDAGKKVITDRAYSLMANIMGTPAADIELNDPEGKKVNLYSMKSDYIVLAIWDPTCSHCKETIPKLDSAYHKRWKAEGVQLFGLARETDGTKNDWLGFIKDHQLNEWRHVYYSKQEDAARTGAGIPSYSQLYDVQTFPTLYLLDKDKRIIAKKVTLEQIDEILTHRSTNQ